MNRRQSKKLRKLTTKLVQTQIKFDLNELDKLLSDKSVLERLRIAFKIIFKIKIYRGA
jgi:hypothetical protein